MRQSRAGGTPDRSNVLAIGFGTSAAMWGSAYLCRLPGVVCPSWLVLLLLVGCLFLGGFLAGRHAPGSGARAGAAVGALSSLLNLLVLGSLLGGEGPNEVTPSALLWVPGSLLAGTALGATGGLLGARWPSAHSAPPDWTAAFSKVAAASTLLLVVMGGLVTSHDAGLAVVDWPNSYGYNMFLFPLSRMTGGIYYEHAHRLFGSFVGLTTLVLAVHLQLVETRRWVKGVALAALALVVVQGILGGLRVTGHLTLASSPGSTTPDVRLAVVHGVLAQLFFAIMLALAVFVSRSWKAGRAGPGSSGADRAMGATLVALLLAQLVCGALLRHLDAALLAHVGLAILVSLVAIVAGVKASTADDAALRRTGSLLIPLPILQVLLGIGALVVTRLLERPTAPGALQVALATAHQATGALLLGCAVTLALWTLRRPSPARAQAAGPTLLAGEAAASSSAS